MKGAKVADPPLALYADWDGAPPSGATPWVLLHGFTGSGGAWGETREALRRLGPTLAVDLVGHGASPVPVEPEPYGMPACLEQLDALLERLAIPPCWWLGYSMGGRVALQMAARYPERVRGLVLESATPGLREAAEQAARISQDEALAETILAEGLEAFVERWLAAPLFAGLGRLPTAERERQRAQRLHNNPLGLANSLRGMGSGAMEPLWHRLSGLRMPVLLITGAEDAKFTAIAREMAGLLPQAAVRVIPDAVHVPHVERPREFMNAVIEFAQSIQ